MPEDYFGERVAERYDDDASVFDPAVVDPCVDFLAELAVDGAALELGIGTGRIALPLAQRAVVPGLQRLPPGETVRAFEVSATKLGFDEYDVARQSLVSRHYDIGDGELEVLSAPFRYVWPSELDLMARLAGIDAARAVGRLEARAVHERQHEARLRVGEGGFAHLTATTAAEVVAVLACPRSLFVAMTPVTAIPADLLTPLGAYLRLRGQGRGSFLLESVERGRLGRNSFVGWGARVVRLEEAETLQVPVVGYLSYDYAAKLEPTVPMPVQGSRFPESAFVAVETLVRFDHGAGIAEVLAGEPNDVARRLAEPFDDVRGEPGERGPLRRFPSQKRYEEMVRTCQDHIRAGDAYQIVPSQRAERSTSASPLALYRALRRVNPSPYLFLLELDDLALVGSSPERLVACEAGRASVCPIAGTTSPGDGDTERLLSSEKDRAEHVMLVDLGRNDLSRVCRAGTVRVTRWMDVERFSHVSHLVSEVAGELHDDVTPFDVLRACFPAGTVTGAPKVRAMQIISELEGYSRGPYAGAVGYVLPDGTMDTCIALRTIVVADGVARLQAGAGVVADSDPAAEHRECLAKLAALEAAIDLAEAEYEA